MSALLALFPSNPIHFVISLIVFLVVLSLLVFVHEFGHFWVAKKLKMGVEEFGFGLPPRLWGKKIKGTLYSINWLPIGGFVKLAGEDEAEVPAQVAKNQAPTSRYFFARPKRERAAVLLAGVAMNFVLAVFILTFIFTQGVPMPNGVTVTMVVPDAPAAIAGLTVNDKIVAVDGKSVIAGEEVTTAVAAKAGQAVTLEIERDGSRQTMTLTPRKNPPAGQGPLGIQLKTEVVTKRYSLLEAPYQGLKEAVKTTVLIFEQLSLMLIRLITFQPAQIDVGGPVKIFQAVDQARQVSLSALGYLTALLSLNLALFNILPIPALDGGRLFFVLFEKFIGRAVRPRLEMAVHQVGMIVLIGLAILITINDLRGSGHPLTPSATPAASNEQSK